MAEILLLQDQLDEAQTVIETLEQRSPQDPRVVALRARLDRRRGIGDPVQSAVAPTGVDQISLAPVDGVLRIDWELTPDGLDLARRRVRYSGRTVIRLFTAAPGPRGVRTTVRDIEAQIPTGAMNLAGTPGWAVHTAAVGFLGHNGEFVPMARALPLSVAP
jgi:hypothetical protein